MTTKEEEKITKLKDKLTKLEQKRERNINRYIIPIEIKLEKLREQINL